MTSNSSATLLPPGAWTALPISHPLHPIVGDANALFQDTVRRARGGFTALTFLAEHGSVALLTVEHVGVKAQERLPEIAADVGMSENLVMETWSTVYEPLIRFVSVPRSMCADDPRVASVNDAEDVPFAQLAIAVGPSLLLTRDHHLHDAGIGTGRWADALVLLGTLIELELVFYGTARLMLNLAYMLAKLTSEGLRFLWRSPIALGLALGASTLLLREGPEVLNRRAHGARRVLGAAGNRALDFAAPHFERREEAQELLGTALVAPMEDPPPDAVCARGLAISQRGRDSHELLMALRRAGYSYGLAELESNLARHPSFVELEGTWRLGI